MNAKSTALKHQKKAENYPEEFLRSRLFSSPKLQRIEGKIVQMDVLVIGYEVEIQETRGMHFKDILYKEYEVKDKENGNPIKLLKENKLNI